MHLLSLQAAIIVSQLCSPVFAFSESCQQLIKNLRIEDQATVNLVQNACQSSSNDSSADQARTACRIARHVFQGVSPSVPDLPEYIDPQSTFYDNRTESSWSNNCWQNSSCIVSPESAEDVAKVMEIITFAHSTYSIRSGGHDFNINHSSVGHAGILIDLVNLNQIRLSIDKKSITVGVGARWGDVYQTLNGSGVSVNGARSPNPGVGGQTLGGGIGWFSNLAGVCAASVIAAEVVLANSSIVRADNTNNSDLLWALKGGGPNYGVVTSFTFKTLNIDQIWFESRLYTHDKNQQLLNALVTYQEIAANDTKANIVYQLSEDTLSPKSFVGFIYLEPVELPSVFQAFYDIPQTVTNINSTIGNLATLASLYYTPVYPQVSPSRNYVLSLPHKINNATYQESYAAFAACAKQAASLGATMNYGSQPITTNAVQASSDTPLGLTLIEQDWVHITIEWTSSSADASVLRLMHTLAETIESSSIKHSADLSYRFMNDAYDGQAVLAGYGADNLESLRRIALAYDVDGVFQRLQNGGWLLNRA